MEPEAELSLGRGKGDLWVEKEGKYGQLVKAEGFAGK